MPRRDQARQVLEQADVAAAQDPLADRLQPPRLLPEEHLPLAEIGAGDAPGPFVVEEDAELRDAEREFPVDDELQGDPARSRDRVDLVERKLGGRRYSRDAEALEDLDAGVRVDVGEVAHVDGKLGEFVAHELHEAEAVHLDCLHALGGRDRERRSEDRERVVPRRRVGREVRAPALLPDEVDRLAELRRPLEGVSFVAAAVNIPEVDRVVGAEIRGAEVAEVRDRGVELEGAGLHGLS